MVIFNLKCSTTRGFVPVTAIVTSRNTKDAAGEKSGEQGGWLICTLRLNIHHSVVLLLIRETVRNKHWTDLSLTNLPMNNLTNRHPVNVHLILHQFKVILWPLAPSSWTNAAVSGFRALDGRPLLGSFSRSYAPYLNLLNQWLATRGPQEFSSQYN